MKRSLMRLKYPLAATLLLAGCDGQCENDTTASILVRADTACPSAAEAFKLLEKEYTSIDERDLEALHTPPYTICWYREPSTQACTGHTRSSIVEALQSLPVVPPDYRRHWPTPAESSMVACDDAGTLVGVLHFSQARTRPEATRVKEEPCPAPEPPNTELVGSDLIPGRIACNYKGTKLGNCLSRLSGVGGP
jgi:hypothetical protein